MRSNIEPEQLLNLLTGVTRESGGLDGSTVSNGLVGVDVFVGPLPVEEVGDEVDDVWNTGGTTDQNDLVDVGLVNLGIAEDLLDRFESTSEEVLAQALEMVTSEGGVEVDTVDEILDLNGGGGSGGEGSLSTLTGGTETMESTGVGGEILLALALKLLDEVVYKPIVKILTTQVGVSGDGLDLEDTLLDGQECGIEGPSTEVKDEDVAFTNGLSIKAVGDGGSDRLVDDAEHVQTTNGTGLPGGLTLGVVEVSGDGNDDVCNGCTEVRLGGLSHLGQDHGGDFLGRLKTVLEYNQLRNDQTYKFFVFGTVLYFDVRPATLIDNLEWELLDIGLYFRIRKFTTDETLDVEDTGEVISTRRSIGRYDDSGELTCCVGLPLLDPLQRRQQDTRCPRKKHRRRLFCYRGHWR